MARDILQKKQRVAHNKVDDKNHEMFNESDFLPSFLEHLRRNDFSALHLNSLEPSVSGTNEAFVRQKTQIPISSQNSTSIPTSKKFRKSNKFPLMEKVARTVQQIKHNTHIPKPKAHLSTLSNLPPKLNSQSSNNNSISLNKSKEAEAKKDLKNINMQNENTEEFEIVNGLNKTGNDASDSDDILYENFIAENRPEKFKSVKNNSKKPQKSTKVAEKHISKSRSPARDFIMNDESTSSESEYNMSGDEKLSSESDSNGSDDEQRASSESDSNASDDETYVPSKQRNKNCKKTKKRREVLNNGQSTLKRKKASTSFAKKHNSRTFSKCSSQESDSNASDDEKPTSSESDSNMSDDETYVPSKQRNKNCKKSKKKHEVVNDRQSTSKRKNTSASTAKTRNSRTFSKFTSQKSDSDISDASTCYYTRNKRIKNNKVFDKRQSSKQDNASASIANKRNSRTLSKSAMQESDFDNSDDEPSYYTRNKRMKKNNEMENRQSTSKVENDSDMINVNDSTYDTDSDLPPPAEIFTGLKFDIYASKSHEERDNLNNQESKFSSLDETCIASSVQFPVLHKTSDNKSMSVNQQSNALHKKSSLKTSLDNGQSNSKCFPTKNDSLSLGDDDQPNVLLKEESSIKTSLVDNGQSNSKCFPTKKDSLSLGDDDQPDVLLKEYSIKTPLADNGQSNSKCFPTKNDSLSLVNNQPYALLEEGSSIKTSFGDNNQSNNTCFTTKNGSVLGNSREKDFSNRPLVDLTESDNECEISFSIMPKIAKISSQIANESESHSEESEIELLDVIVHELPEKNKTSCSSKKVGSNSSNDSIINPVNVDQILSCNNVKPQETLLNGKNEAAYSTGICQDNDKKAESKDMSVSQFNLNKDKPESSIENNALSTLISSNEVKKESHNDCEIVLDIASTNNSNQNLLVVQSCNNAIIKAERDSKSVEEVAPIGVAKNDSIIKERSNHSSIVSIAENYLSKNVKKEVCNDDCQIVLDIASANNSNQNLPGVQICNNLNIKSEGISKTIKEVTPIAVNTSCSISKEQSIQSISNTEDSLISNKNIKKEPCDDDCKIVLDIDSTNKSNQNLPALPDVSSKIKIENYSKVVDQVTPVHVAKSGPIITKQNKLTQNEQKLHEVESSNSKKLTASHNETSEHLEKEKMNELDSGKIKVLLERVKKELATYQEIIEAEETVQNAFKSLERRQAEKLMAIKSAIVECIEGTQSISECNSIKNAVSNLLDSSELLRSQVQDFKVFTSINLVPLASITEDDIKPSLPELQCALTQQPSTSARRNSIDHNWSFGQKCMVCAKDATSACKNCCKVFFCSDECGVKYWESGHKNACKYL